MADTIAGRKIGTQRKTEDDYRALALSRGYSWKGPEVANAKIKTSWECKEGHRWEASYSSIQNGYGCPECAIARRSVLNRKRPFDYYALAAQNGFKWLGPEVRSVTTRTGWECAQGHRWETTYSKISSVGTGCHVCNIDNQRIKPDAYQALAAQHGFSWLGPEVRSVGTRTGWQCEHGHQWQGTYNSIRQGAGCETCTGRLLRRSAKTISAFSTIATPVELELVHVAAGEFLMGSDATKDRDACDDEQPQQRVYVPEFHIGRYPVTNKQYAAFVAVNKVEIQPPSHWTREGKGWIFPDKDFDPVVDVSWHDAVAFCRWLSDRSGQAFRLPSEAEWEKAARGADGRIYPWGDRWDIAKANTKESGVGTTRVSSFSMSAGGVSPYGAADMVGNVFEWTQSKYTGYPYVADDGRNDPNGGESRVLRGGSWASDATSARCACRLGLGAKQHYDDAGFRVATIP